ncbi:MAG TPA: radical SAM family heme chaperone HemW, partial [Mycobacteriales bacterium]|nr:radical SAM family heme chaperone HemW [Mycobacteriales bacterium]
MAGLQVVPGEIRSGDRFGAYVHVPYCATRCGYCDFNTYTPGELGNSTTGLSQSDEVTSYLTAVMAEVELAARVLSEDGSRALPIVDTVFIGGGTPTQLAPDQLGGILRRLDETFGLAPDAEITTEANPESVTARQLAELRTAGFTRISLGMQSAVEHVLSVLDRSHTPGRALEAAKQARTEGFAHVSLDLIYGTPTESDDDWRASLQAAISADVDHISAYALTVEPGTRMARQVARGELAMIDDDVLADRYQLADRILSEAGFSWYEISNWARTPGDRCRHNELYWRGGDWWGFGPGAHSHAGGVRWWNVKHPAA